MTAAHVIVNGGTHLPGWFFALVGAGLLAAIFWPHKNVGSEDGCARRVEPSSGARGDQPLSRAPRTRDSWSLVAEGFRAGSVRRWE